MHPKINKAKAKLNAAELAYYKTLYYKTLCEVQPKCKHTNVGQCACWDSECETVDVRRVCLDCGLTESDGFWGFAYLTNKKVKIVTPQELEHARRGPVITAAMRIGWTKPSLAKYLSRMVADIMRKQWRKRHD